ncbi:hypothetical protein ACPOL_1879 [Acidisarcina polymorpha]|uniref:Uncharacterized protein n=1 Tax=Acidisarcina polymorpha TaxID=2211140 RepID=A0A2Z5FWG1_9BACT|nr:hypothetical protein ACPOL_1879 [Acidisarcina polymorpha]
MATSARIMEVVGYKIGNIEDEAAMTSDIEIDSADRFRQP